MNRNEDEKLKHLTDIEIARNAELQPIHQIASSIGLSDET